MKFSKHKYWKRKRNCCEFFEVLEVHNDDGKTAELTVSWNEQQNGYWLRLIKNFDIRIMEKEYDTWNEFTPRGDRVVRSEKTS